MKSIMGKMSEDLPGGLTPGYHPASMAPMTTDTTTRRTAGRRAKLAPETVPWDTDDAWLDAMDAAYDAAPAAVRHGVTTGRDVFGRFTRRTHVDAVTVWFHGADGVDHATTTCANIVGSRRRPGGPIVGCDDRRSGWTCTGCVHVDDWSHAYAVRNDMCPSMDPYPCATCGTVRNDTAYPTIVMCGVRVRGVACRKCETAARAARTPFDNYAMTYAARVYDPTEHPIYQPGDATRVASVVGTVAA